MGHAELADRRAAAGRGGGAMGHAELADRRAMAGRGGGAVRER
jgi:hypothetical protein